MKYILCLSLFAVQVFATEVWRSGNTIRPGDRLKLSTEHSGTSNNNGVSFVIAHEGTGDIEYSPNKYLPDDNLEIADMKDNPGNFYINFNDDGGLIVYDKNDKYVNTISYPNAIEGYPYNMKLYADRRLRIKDVTGKTIWMHPEMDDYRTGIYSLKSNSMNYLRPGEALMSKDNKYCIGFTTEGKIDAKHISRKDISTDINTAPAVADEDDGAVLILEKNGELNVRFAHNDFALWPPILKPVPPAKGPFELKITEEGELVLMDINSKRKIWGRYLMAIDDARERLKKTTIKSEELKSKNTFAFRFGYKAVCMTFDAISQSLAKEKLED